ncbi:putative galactokinase [Selenomonas ruminantium subsp. lactilytica TAM6421]|uniref:Galactokinase n=1 Tax=Selenomonas ruminantium subsp. lactilytica (strain NBRC 103574 / TAM6421) TaxID=927704 RepID=I0GT97_SELRL|nr:galactokinase [Selenomonas ruminantium]BAL83984.1 putative galactokinase [Selenomonas ruminantium subsp. lactilytica TAM6421]
MEQEILTKMQSEFAAKFGEQETRAYFSPGRVNLIGEHTDYNGGHVFPCAISLGTYALVADRQDSKTRIYSMNLADKGVIEFDMSGLSYDKAKDWANYPMGVVKVFEDAGHKASHGFDILVYGTLPNGSGLSSSASIEVLTALILNDAFDFGLDMVEMVKLSQKAENTFVGVNCGIMDQFAVGMGKKDCAILLDCNTLEYRYSKIALEGASIVITNTNKPHSLASSAYNVRRAQCEHALNELKEVKPELNALGELSNEEFNQLAGAISEPLERQRARHAVLENNRTLEAVEALEQNDVEKFGKLMNESHYSLRDDYDVTGKELDTLAELAWQVEGVIGSRMTGAGFGGCTVSLVKNEAIESFKEKVGKAYTEKIGYAPSFYVANIADGTHRIK